MNPALLSLLLAAAPTFHMSPPKTAVEVAPSNRATQEWLCRPQPDAPAVDESVFAPKPVQVPAMDALDRLWKHAVDNAGRVPLGWAEGGNSSDERTELVWTTLESAKPNAFVAFVVLQRDGWQVTGELIGTSKESASACLKSFAGSMKAGTFDEGQSESTPTAQPGPRASEGRMLSFDLSTPEDWRDVSKQAGYRAFEMPGSTETHFCHIGVTTQPLRGKTMEAFARERFSDSPIRTTGFKPYDVGIPGGLTAMRWDIAGAPRLGTEYYLQVAPDQVVIVQVVATDETALSASIVATGRVLQQIVHAAKH